MERRLYERNKETEQLTSISKAKTPEEIGDYWDSHSLADHWDQTHDVEFEVRAIRQRRLNASTSPPPDHKTATSPPAPDATPPEYGR